MQYHLQRFKLVFFDQFVVIKFKKKIVGKSVNISHQRGCNKWCKWLETCKTRGVAGILLSCTSGGGGESISAHTPWKVPAACFVRYPSPPLWEDFSHFCGRKTHFSPFGCGRKVPAAFFVRYPSPPLQEDYSHFCGRTSPTFAGEKLTSPPLAAGGKSCSMFCQIPTSCALHFSVGKSIML